MFREFEDMPAERDEDAIEGAMVYIPEKVEWEGIITAVSPRRLYGIILTDKDEHFSFDMETGSLMQKGDWVYFTKDVNEHRIRAINVRLDHVKESFDKMSL
jgi:hypothetical protein